MKGSFEKYVDIGNYMQYNINCSREINRITNRTINSNLNRKSLPRLVRLIINRDKIDTYKIKIKYNILKQINIQ